ncbi:hypothetical protein Gpo141_00009806 [Globisporangium polare]
MQSTIPPTPPHTTQGPVAVDLSTPLTQSSLMPMLCVSLPPSPSISISCKIAPSILLAFLGDMSSSVLSPVRSNSSASSFSGKMLSSTIAFHFLLRGTV